MDAVVVFCWIVIIGLVLFLYDFIAKIVIKYTAHRRTGVLWFVHHLIPRRVSCPNLMESPYWNRFPSSRDRTYECTLDDPVIQALAEDIVHRTRFMTQRGRASYILSLVQQNVTYRKDGATFGKVEKYGFPVCTLYLRGNDCEDSAFLGASLSWLCGLDVAIVHVEGHLAYGCNVRGWGTKFSHEGKSYVWCEGIGFMPIGVYTGTTEVLGTYNPTMPPSDYIENHTYEDDFEQYKS